MASPCYNLWEEVANQKGDRKWINKGQAPDGVCPSCPEMQFCPDGFWDGVQAICINGSIVKRVCNGAGGLRNGPVLMNNSPACNGDFFVGSGSLHNYFS